MSLVHAGSQLFSKQTSPVAQWVLAVHSSQLPVGSPAEFGVRSQCLSVVSSAQSVSERQSMHRLLARSQTSPVSHIAVPHGVTQSPFMQVAPLGQ